MHALCSLDGRKLKLPSCYPWLLSGPVDYHYIAHCSFGSQNERNMGFVFSKSLCSICLVIKDHVWLKNWDGRQYLVMECCLLYSAF